MNSYITQIRELINGLILRSLLLKDLKRWHLMCGSLDAIESAQTAVDSYKALDKNHIKDIGEHLVIYGLFQALYVQQDSVSNLCESMNLDLFKDMKTQHPKLHEIRELRNKGIGHPSKDRHKNVHNILIDGDFIELFSYTETGEFSFTKYRISDCIETQNRLLCRFMQQVINKMNAMEKEHKDKYMQDKLRDCLRPYPQNDIDYIFGAIEDMDNKSSEESSQEKIPKENRISRAKCAIRELIEAIDKFNGKFIERGLVDNSVGSDIRHSKYPLEKLKEYFDPTPNSSINSMDAWAYVDSAEEHILDLTKHAERLDNMYLS